MKKLLPVLLFFCSSANLFSQTLVSGTISSSTTWTKANSPYIIKNNVIVDDSVDLTLQPGVVVRMDSTTARITFNPGSTLYAVGTSSDSIRFISGVSQSQQAWDQLSLIYAKGITLKYVRFSGSQYGVDVYPNTFYKIENCAFFNNGVGLRIKGNADSNSYVNNCHFKDNVNAFYLFYNKFGSSNLKFTNNTNAVFLSSAGILSDCEFYYNSQAVSTTGGTIANSILMWNGTAVNSGGGILSCNTILHNDIGVYFNKVAPDSTNKICHNNQYNLVLGSSTDATVIRLCMCSTDSSYLASKIYDQYDDSMRGIVHFNQVRSCDSTSSVCSMINSIPEKDLPDLKLYPNPMSGATLLFNPALFVNARVDILNMIGTSVRTYEKVNGNELEIARDGLPAGTYFILIRNGNGVYRSMKLMISE